MKWMKERDLLIAQTLAFVQSVTGKLPESDKAESPAADKKPATAPPADAPSSVESREPVLATTPLAEVSAPLIDSRPRPAEPALPLPILVEPSPPIEEAPQIVAQHEPKPAPAIDLFSPPDLRVDFQSEIKARVASFRAHQERFSREREAYCSTTMAKVHASIREVVLPTISGK